MKAACVLKVLLGLARCSVWPPFYYYYLVYNESHVNMCWYHVSYLNSWLYIKLNSYTFVRLYGFLQNDSYLKPTGHTVESIAWIETTHNPYYLLEVFTYSYNVYSSTDCNEEAQNSDDVTSRCSICVTHCWTAALTSKWDKSTASGEAINNTVKTRRAKWSLCNHSTLFLRSLTTMMPVLEAVWDLIYYNM